MRPGVVTRLRGPTQFGPSGKYWETTGRARERREEDLGLSIGQDVLKRGQPRNLLFRVPVSFGGGMSRFRYMTDPLSTQLDSCKYRGWTNCTPAFTAENCIATRGDLNPSTGVYAIDACKRCITRARARVGVGVMGLRSSYPPAHPPGTFARPPTHPLARPPETSSSAHPPTRSPTISPTHSSGSLGHTIPTPDCTVGRRPKHCRLGETPLLRHTRGRRDQADGS